MVCTVPSGRITVMVPLELGSTIAPVPLGVVRVRYLLVPPPSMAGP